MGAAGGLGLGFFSPFPFLTALSFPRTFLFPLSGGEGLIVKLSLAIWPFNRYLLPYPQNRGICGGNWERGVILVRYRSDLDGDETTER